KEYDGLLYAERLGRAMGKCDTSGNFIRYMAIYDEDASIREKVVIALGGTGNSSAIDTLKIVLLNNEETPTIRKAAATALGKLGGPNAIWWLKNVAVHGDEVSQDIREAAATELVNIGEPAIEALEKDANGKICVYERCRIKAIKILGDIGGPEAIKVLAILLTDKNEVIWKAALRAIAVANQQGISE
ncbi:HEAT repeat domain-containing protein, partial [Candidatus Omnitrophota bacterium]